MYSHVCQSIYSPSIIFLSHISEMTIEEWIEWMEEKKKTGMSPEQLAELERRKTNWLEEQKLREDKRKREEEAQLAKTRKKMESELK